MGRRSHWLLTRAAKRGFDVLVCGVGLLALWPVGLCAAAAVALEDGRPVLYAAPRPGDPAFAALYAPAQRAVLALRPGITGPAQVVFADEARLLRPGHVYEDYVTRVLPVKLAIDLDYVAAPSLGRDLRVLWATAR